MFNPKMTMVVDVDDTICFTKDRDYVNSIPNEPVVKKLREARAKGWWIILHTARGQGRTKGKIDYITKVEVITEVMGFCIKHDVPYDQIITGKPWAAMYVDDKAVRPDEFANINLDEWSPKL